MRRLLHCMLSLIAFVLMLNNLSLFVLGQSESTNTSSTVVNGIVFQHPDAVQVELAAESPLVKWPIVADWDDRGRLVIVESAGVRQSVEEQRKTLPHRMIRLADNDGDGVFDERIVAAENLAFPEGVLCLGNQILVATPPEIWSFTDTDGDGVCEKREVWFDGKTLTYCANDLHGPYLGRDGWIYWCKGAFAEQSHELVNGKTLKTKASHVFRRRLAGGPIEPVMTGGMDNPVELAITPEGERFFTSTFLQHPSAGLRDGIAHAVYGGVYGKDHNVIDGHPRTGPLMPIMTQLGPAAPSGLICLNSDAMQTDIAGLKETKNILAVAQFNLQKISLHGLIESGASYTTIDRDLLVGDRIDFHPTDVIEDADGSLLVIDTGGWYDLCCPSSGVDQDLASGGIYRIRSSSTDAIDLPRGAAVAKEPSSWYEKSIEELSLEAVNARWWVRREAFNELVKRRNESLHTLAGILQDAGVEERIRQDALWALCRIDSNKSLSIVEQQIQSQSPNIRQAAIHALSVQRTGSVPIVANLVVSDPSPQVRRVAAEAIGRLDNPAAVDSLLEALATTKEDRMLEHSLLYALIELNQPQMLVDRLKDSSPPIQRACLDVLAQIAPDSLNPQYVFDQATSADSLLRTSARNLLTKNPGWSSELTAQLDKCWQEALQNTFQRELLRTLIAAWKDRTEVTVLVQSRLQLLDQMTPEDRSLLNDVVQQLNGITVPVEWTKPICALIAASRPDEQIGLANWLASCKHSEAATTELSHSLVELAEASRPNAAQAYALVSYLPSPVKVSRELSEAIIGDVLNSTDEHLKNLAARALVKISLNANQAKSLVGQLPQIDPLRLQDAVLAISRVGDDEADLDLLKRLSTLPAARTLNADSVASFYKNRSSSIIELAKSTTEMLARPPEQLEATLSSWESELAEGDPVKGYQVFRSAKAACSACHKIGYVGGGVGPDLTRIGATRTKRDLLEAILFPSVRFAQSYHPVRILTTDGQVYNGLITNENASEIDLLVAADKTVRIPTDSIEERKTSTVSVMPAGLEEVISKKDIADLIALLQASK
jgi:putative membrane-bound dehydrogenase-like protein